MPPDARKLRVHVYDWLLERGVPPTSTELAAELSESPAEVRRALNELGIGKTILIDSATGEIRMAGPFSAGATPYRVIGERVQWFANCGWDMLGVAVLVDEPVRIEASCTDCGAPMTYDVDPRTPERARDLSGVVHFLVPARRWYDDIGYT